MRIFLKSLSWFFITCLFLFVFYIFADNKSILSIPDNAQKQFLTINIISSKNGVGLSRDVALLEKELTKLGHKVGFIDFQKHDPPASQADINIFIQIGDEFFFSFAKRNYLIPNPECCLLLSYDKVPLFDLILCRTKEVERIYKTMNSNTVHMSFTCEDRYDPTVIKNYKQPIHLAGASIQKGTDRIAKIWEQNPDLPLLTMIRHLHKCQFPSLSNLKVVFEYLPDADLKKYQNQCGMHLCPSESEGFGHYIMEAMSCGAVVISTNAPPMNEFVLDKRCLIDYDRTGTQNIATLYYIDVNKGASVIKGILALNDNELKAIGKKNREFYLKNDKYFKKKLSEIFIPDYPLKPKIDPAEIVFTKIYTNKMWGPFHGDGSTPQNTKLYRQFLQDFMKEHEIHSVVDVGCGNWLFSQLMDWSNIDYTGYDIVKEIIDENQAKFSTPSIKFIHGNAILIDLPKADLLICKDVLQHLPNEDILKMIAQFTKFKHCLIVNDVNPNTLKGSNSYINLGEYRHPDLADPPFNVNGKRVLTFISKDNTKQVFYIKN